MNSSSKKRKKSSPHCISGIQDTERTNKGSVSPEKSEKKVVWTSVALSKQMKPTIEEIRYRKKKLELENPLEKYSRYFKCTKCQLNFKPLDQNIEIIAIHSCLKVLFCKDCLNFYEDGEFSVDSDGEEKYCRWCGEGGLIYSCSQCVSGFCTVCIKKHFGVKYHGQVRRNNNWKCFLCFPKPIWFLRFICSIVEGETKCKITILTPDPKARNGANRENINSKDCNGIPKIPGSGKDAKKLCINVEDESCTSCSIIASDVKKSSGEVKVTSTPKSKKGFKRKQIAHSSSDESDDMICTQQRKKVKAESLNIRPSKISGFQNIKCEIVEKLEKILRLAEYQMAFGVNWSSKMLTKLYQPNSLNTAEEIKNECQKIKWFFSILSTYLVESCSSVDAIEKSIDSNEQKIVQSPDKTHGGDYSTVVKFLDFITNQVKVFLEKGICLQDLLEGEIYYDSQIIGIKVKTNTSAGTSGASPPKGKLKINERIFDSKPNSGEKTSDDESIRPTLELEADRDSSDTDDYSSRKLTLSDPTQDYLEDAEEQKTKIQEILSILENA